MDQILSQDEVDALLRGISDGEVETETTSEEVQEPTEGPVPYDLTRQERIVRGKMPGLDVIHKHFIKLLQITMGNVLRKPVEVMVADQAVMKFSKFIKRLPMPTSVTVMTMKPLQGLAMVAMDAMTVYVLVDHLLGGAGQTHVKPEGRDFSTIEQRVIKRIVELLFADLEKGWARVHRVAIQPVRYENNPQFASIVTPSEIVMVITLRLEIFDTAGELFLCLPYAMLEPIKEKLQASFQSDQLGKDPRWLRRFCDGLKEADVNVSVELGETTISVQDLLNFTVGDVVMLDKRIEEPLEGSVQGIPKFKGYGAQSNGTQWFRIESILPPLE